MEPVEKRERVKSRGQKKVSKRQSLAGFYLSFISSIHLCLLLWNNYSLFPASGTSWNSGVRRSTRIRTRPLEYWKGERPVYGRVHQSK